MLLPTLCLVASLGAVPRPEVSLTRFDLPNGVSVLMVHVPDASKQAMFTMLPLSLATDQSGRAQWSHLLEHMLIRSTDSQGLSAGGVSFNGETGPDNLRVETIALPAEWKAALERHGKWLAARRVDPALLEQEKLVIAGEEQSTAANGFTHKWAVAAWNQAIRHGRDTVALHGEVVAAKAPDVESAMNALLPVGPGVLFATIGPVDPAELRPEIEAALGGVARDPMETDALKASKPRFTGAHTATWDLPTRHALLWWQLPDGEPATLAAGAAAAMALQMRLFAPVAPPGARQPPSARTFVHANVLTPEGPFLIVNSFIPAGVDAEAHMKRVTEIAAELGKFPTGVVGAAKSLGTELGRTPDFAAFRRMGGRAGGGDFLEANWFLPIMTQEMAWRQPRDAIAASLRAVDETNAKPVLDLLQQGPMGTLVIEPNR